MIESAPFLLTGVTLGLAAGLAPGPLLALVVSETLRHGKGHGILVAFAPILTDIPIVLLSVYIMGKLSGFNTLLGVISIAGALFISYLAYDSITARKLEQDKGNAKAGSLGKGVMTNLLSPHPYLFWVTVGAPLVYKAYGTGPAACIAFLTGFYLFLVGSKVTLAIMLHRSRSLLGSRALVYIFRALALMLMLLALMFLKEGIGLLKTGGG